MTSEAINKMKAQIDRYDDPLELIGRNISYDDFVDWLDIVDEVEETVEDKIKALKDTRKQFEKYNYRHHVEIITVKIKSYKKVKK